MLYDIILKCMKLFKNRTIYSFIIMPIAFCDRGSLKLRPSNWTFISYSLNQLPFCSFSLHPGFSFIFHKCWISFGRSGGCAFTLYLLTKAFNQWWTCTVTVLQYCVLHRDTPPFGLTPILTWTNPISMIYPGWLKAGLGLVMTKAVKV